MPGKQARLSELESLMAEPGFWDRKEQAQKQVEEVSALRAKIGPLVALESQVADLETLQLLADEETDPAQQAAARADLAAEFARTRQGSSKTSNCSSFFPARTINPARS